MKLKSLTARLAALLCACGFAFSAWADNVAKIGDTEYATLKAAFAAVKDGETVQLIGDLEYSSSNGWSDQLVVDGKNVTFDLNGHNVTYTRSANPSGSMFYLKNGAELSIDGTGTIVLTPITTSHTVFSCVGMADNTGLKATLGANVTVYAECFGNVEYNTKNAETGSTFDIYGTIIGNNSSYDNILFSCPSGVKNFTVNILGGTLEIPRFSNQHINIQASTETTFTLNMSSGKIYCTQPNFNAVKFNLHSAVKSTFNITGGYFGSNVPKQGTDPTLGFSLPAGYGFYPASGVGYCPYQVGVCEAKIGNVCYPTISAAIEAATPSNFVVLNVNYSDTVTIPAGKTVNFNSGAYTFSGSFTVNGTLKIVGGTYTFNPAVELLGPGCSVTDNGDGTWTVIQSVAQVGETSYTTFADALTAANALGTATIKFLADVDLGSSSINIASGKNITLDLNGNNVSCSGNDGFSVKSGATLVLCDTSDGQSGALTHNGSWDLVDNYGIVEVLSGTYNVVNYGVAYKNNSAALYIRGGIISSTKNAYTGSAVISDGTVLGNLSSGTVITGGVFDHDPTLYVDQENYQVLPNTPSAGYWTVGAPQPVAQIVRNDAVFAQYETLAAAFGAAVDGDTIELLADVELTAALETSGKSFILDGKGFTLSPASDLAAAYHYLYFGFSGSAAITYTIKNLTIAGFSNTAYFFRLEGNIDQTCTMNLDNVTFSGITATRIIRDVWADLNLTSCQFLSNTATMQVIDLNSDSHDNIGRINSLSIENCLFATNTVTAGSGIIYTAEDKTVSVANSTFEGNTVSAENNAAIVYFGDLGGDCTGCLFKDNVVNYTTTSGYADRVRAAGAIFTWANGENPGTISGNAFVNNSVVKQNANFLTCYAKAIYSGGYYNPQDLAGNYFGGSAPVIGQADKTTANNDIYAEYGSKAVTASTYAESYTLNNNNYGVTVTLYVPPVAQIGETKYETLAAAILAAQDGDTIEILDGTWGVNAVGTMTTKEALSVRAKSLTIQPAEGATVKFTSNVMLGYDDSSTRSAAITVKGLSFENAQLLIGNYAQTTVEDCSFVGSGSSAALSVIESCASNYNRTDFIEDQVTIRNCAFDGTASGQPAIRVRNSGNLLIEDNTIENSAHNGILLESNGTVNTLVAKTVVIQNNVINEWNASDVKDGGRGIRAALGTPAAGSTVTITGNVFHKETTGLDKPDFAKITEAGNATVDLSGNDWNDMLLSEVKDNSAIYTCSVTATLDSVITTKVPVAKIGTTEYLTLADAFAAATSGATITLLADCETGAEFTISNPLKLTAANVTLDLNGKTVTVDNNFSFGVCASGVTVCNGSIVSAVNNAKTTKINSYILVVGAVGVNDAISGVTLDGVTMVGGLSVGGSSDAVIKGKATGTVLTDCDITSGDYYTVCSQNHSDVTIESGTYTANTANGCTTSGVLQGCFIGEDGPEGSIVVNGGSFTGAINASNVGLVVLKGGYYSAVPNEGLIYADYLCTTKPYTGNLYKIVDKATVTFSVGTGAPDVESIPASFVYPSGDRAEIKLSLPTYTSEDFTFGGWTYTVDDTTVNIGTTFPAGTTGDKALVGTWTKAAKIEVATDSTKPEKTVEVKVTEDWVNHNVTKTGETATVEQIQDALTNKQDNGLTGLENYVLGLNGKDPNAKLKVDSTQSDSETSMPVVNTVKQTVDTGFTVKYSLDKVNESGTVTEAGQKQETSDLDLNLAAATSDSNSAYFKMTATITKKEGNTETTVKSVPSENTIGVMKVESQSKTTVIGVPWTSLSDDGSISVADIVRTSTLSEGDQIQVYDTVANGYRSWTLDDKGAWVADEVIGGGASTEQAQTVKIDRGKGVLLTRTGDKSKPIYLVGSADKKEESVSTTLEKAPDEHTPAWNLVASPSVEAKTIEQVVGVNTTDSVIVPTDEGPRNYTYKDGKWGYDGFYGEPVEIAPGIFAVKPKRITDDKTIPAGRGFWYLNKDKDSSTKKIIW